MADDARTRRNTAYARVNLAVFSRHYVLEASLEIHESRGISLVLLACRGVVRGVNKLLCGHLGFTSAVVVLSPRPEIVLKQIINGIAVINKLRRIRFSNRID